MQAFGAQGIADGPGRIPRLKALDNPAQFRRGLLFGLGLAVLFQARIFILQPRGERLLVVDEGIQVQRFGRLVLDRIRRPDRHALARRGRNGKRALACLEPAHAFDTVLQMHLINEPAGHDIAHLIHIRREIEGPAESLRGRIAQPRAGIKEANLCHELIET